MVDQFIMRVIRGVCPLGQAWRGIAARGLVGEGWRLEVVVVPVGVVVEERVAEEQGLEEAVGEEVVEVVAGVEEEEVVEEVDVVVEVADCFGL